MADDPFAQTDTAPQSDPFADSSVAIAPQQAPAMPKLNWWQTGMQAAERYPQGVMKTAEDLQTGVNPLATQSGAAGPNLLYNFFSPTPDSRDATQIAQQMGERAMPEAVINNPDSHMEYLKTEATQFIKELPFTTMGVTSEFANPSNAFLAGAIKYMPNVHINAPAWVDSAIDKVINMGFGPSLASLNETLRNKLSNHLADSIHDKVQNAPGWMDQFKSKYGDDVTSDDVKGMIRNKINIAVDSMGPSNIDLAKAIFKVKGSNLPGIMNAPKGIPVSDLYGKGADEPAVEVPPVAPASVDSVGAAGKQTSEPVVPMTGNQRTEHLTRVQFSLNAIQEAENKRAEDLTAKGIPTAPAQVPQAQELDKVLQEKLLNVSQKELEKPEGNDQSVNKAILETLHRNEVGELDSKTERPVSAVTMNQNKADAEATPVFDWRTLGHTSIGELAQQIKSENLVREQQGLPLIDPNKDLIVNKHTYAGQEKGIENKVRDAIILAYNRAPANTMPAKVPPSDPFAQMPTEAPPDPFNPTHFVAIPIPENHTPDAMKIAEQVGQHAADNLSNVNDNSAQSGIENVGPESTRTISPSAATSPTLSPGSTIATIDKDLPKAEHIMHDQDQIQAHVARNIVKETQDVEALLNIVRGLGTQLAGKTFDEAQELISQAAGISVARVKALLKEGMKNDVRNTEASLQNQGVAYRLDKEEHLREAMQLFQDWDESRSQRNLPQPKSLNAPTTKDLREKGIDGDRSKESKFWNTPDESINASTIDHLGQTREGISKEQVEKMRKVFDSQARKSTNKMKEQVIAHHGVYDKLYIDEIEALAGTLEENSGARKTIEDAMVTIKKLISNGTKELNGHEVYKTLIDNSHIKYAMNKLRDAVREAEQDTARAKQKQEEATGYENLTKEEVDAEAAEHPDDRAAKEPTDPSDHESEAVRRDDFSVEEAPFMDDGEELMYTMDPIKMAKAAFSNPKIYKYDGTDRECATPTVITFMRQNPTIAKLDDWFTFKMGGDIAMQKKAIDLKERFSSGEAKDSINSFAMYEGAIDGIIAHDLMPLYKDMEAQIKQFYKEHPTVQLKGKEALQQMVDKYSSLLAEASEQIVTPYYDPHTFHMSELGNGPHKDAFEKDAYVKSMKEWYDFFKKPYTQADIIRWNTQRTPDIWNLLKDPAVMNNDKLQRIVLFYKAQMEKPLFDEQVKNGHYSNADIWKSTIEGYHHKNFAPKGEQSDLGTMAKSLFVRKAPLGAVKLPKATYSSQQAFKSAARTDSWVATNDFFTDNAAWMKKAHMANKQTELLNEISKLPLPKLEFFSPNFEKALADKPIPEEWTTNLKKVHSATDKIIIDIADHMTHAMFTPAEIQKGLDIEKQTGKNPYSVTPMTVLQEGGWIQSHQDDGLNRWYRGSFAPPFVYKTLYSMIDTIFRTASGYDSMGGLMRLFMGFKQVMLMDSIVHTPQYIGNVIATMPLHTAPLDMVSLPLKSTAAFFKGIVKTGPDILAGNYTHEVGETAEERKAAREYTEAGATMVGGYNVFMHNMIGKADLGLFPQRQSFGHRLTDYFMSGLGTGPSVLGEMIGNHALKIMMAMTKEYETQGIDHKTAVRATVDRCNTAMNNLNQISWAGSKLGTVLSIGTFSKNFAVASTRMMIMAMQTPVGGGVAGALAGAAVAGIPGAAVGAVAGSKMGAGKNARFRNAGNGAWTNVFTGADTSESYRDTVNSAMARGIGLMLFWTTMMYGVTQLALYEMQSDEDKKNSSPFWWNNPTGPGSGSVNLFMHNVMNKPVYAQYNGFRLGNDLATELAPIISSAVRNVTGKKDYSLDGDKDYGKTIANKFGYWLTYIEMAVNHKFMTNDDKVFDSDETSQWKQTAEWMSYGMGRGMIPINPFIGASTEKTPFSEDKFKDFSMKLSTIYGMKYKTGYPDGNGVTQQEMQEEHKAVGHADYIAKNGTNPFSNFNGGRNLDSPEAMDAALQRGEVTRKQYVNFFKKENPNNYFKANRQKIWNAAAQESSSTGNPFLQAVDAVENPENH